MVVHEESAEAVHELYNHLLSCEEQFYTLCDLLDKRKHQELRKLKKNHDKLRQNEKLIEQGKHALETYSSQLDQIEKRLGKAEKELNDIPADKGQKCKLNENDPPADKGQKRKLNDIPADKGQRSSSSSSSSSGASMHDQDLQENGESNKSAEMIVGSLDKEMEKLRSQLDQMNEVCAENRRRSFAYRGQLGQRTKEIKALERQLQETKHALEEERKLRVEKVGALEPQSKEKETLKNTLEKNENEPVPSKSSSSNMNNENLEYFHKMYATQLALLHAELERKNATIQELKEMSEPRVYVTETRTINTMTDAPQIISVSTMTEQPRNPAPIKTITETSCTFAKSSIGNMIERLRKELRSVLKQKTNALDQRISLSAWFSVLNQVNEFLNDNFHVIVDNGIDAQPLVEIIKSWTENTTQMFEVENRPRLTQSLMFCLYHLEELRLKTSPNGQQEGPMTTAVSVVQGNKKVKL